MGNSFGHMFRITTWGESHGDAVGVVVDGCPPGLLLDLEEIQKQLDRAATSDLEAAIQAVTEAGGSLVERGEHQPGVPFAYVADPDGYVVEF